MIEKLSLKKSSIKKNFLFNLLLTLSNVIFPFVTFPYVSRILGPDGIGKVQFVVSFVQYFVFLAALGVPIYGIREVAKAKNTPVELKKIFSTLLVLNLITTFTILIIYLGLVFFIPSLYVNIEFYIVAALMLLMSFSSIDWFFSGIEQFKFIALRSIIVKTIFLIILFLVVQEKSDVLPFLWVTIGGTVLSNIWNLFSVRKYFNFKIVKKEDFKRHLKPLFFIFSTVVAASIYSSLDVIILGFLKGFKDVGYYSSGTKISKICIPILTAMSVVIMPQIAQSFRENNDERIKYLLKESFEFVILLGVPMVMGLMILAPEIILTFSGNKFIPSILTMQINAPIVLIIGISTICSVQILTPAAKDMENTVAVIFGLFVSVILNFILIPHYGYLGATVSNLLAELTVMICFVFYALKVIKLEFNLKLFVGNLFISLFFLPIVYFLRNFVSTNNVIVILTSVCFCGSWYAFFQIFVLKNKFVLKHFVTLKQRYL